MTIEDIKAQASTLYVRLPVANAAARGRRENMNH